MKIKNAAELIINSPFSTYEASNFQFSIINYQLKKMDKKTIWKTIIQTLVTILTAIGTTLGVTSCMGL